MSRRMSVHEPVSAKVDNGGGVAALCYTLIEPPSPDEYNDAYAAELCLVARRLPSEYIETIP